MNTQEAKLILRSYRPESAEAGDASYAEALAMVGTDAELRAWFEREQDFNRALVAGQERIAVPAGLTSTRMWTESLGVTMVVVVTATPGTDMIRLPRPRICARQAWPTRFE